MFLSCSQILGIFQPFVLIKKSITDKLVSLMRTLPPFLCQCSVLRLYKAKATQIRGKSATPASTS